MKQCPSCQKWTLDFDDYFGRYRCFDPDCGWMPSSSAERQIQLLRTRSFPAQITVAHVQELGLTMTCSYEKENDALVFDFGLNEPCFDLPEGDGQMLWKISRRTGSVTGFAILEAKRLGVSRVQVNLDARKEDIEAGLRRVPEAVAVGRATRVLISNVEVTAHSVEQAGRSRQPHITNAFREAVNRFEEMGIGR